LTDSADVARISAKNPGLGTFRRRISRSLIVDFMVDHDLVFGLLQFRHLAEFVGLARRSAPKSVSFRGVKAHFDLRQRPGATRRVASLRRTSGFSPYSTECRQFSPPTRLAVRGSKRHQEFPGGSGKASLDNGAEPRPGLFFLRSDFRTLRRILDGKRIIELLVHS
jgi:hypothetical protein